jgi:hypothetical protein
MTRNTNNGAETMYARQTYKGRRIPISSSVAFDAMYDRDILRDAYKSLVSTLPHRKDAIRAAMAAGKGKSNMRVAALLETVAHEHFGSTAEAAEWIRRRKIKSFRNPCGDMF